MNPECPSCKRTCRKYYWQRFKDNTLHIRVDCSHCGRYFFYAQQTEENVNKIVGDIPLTIGGFGNAKRKISDTGQWELDIEEDFDRIVEEGGSIPF